MELATVVEPTALLDLLRARRSHKMPFLSPDAIDPTLVDRVLEAARWAPSHGRTEPWHFTVFTGGNRGALGDAFAAAYQLDAERKGTFSPEAFETNRTKVWKVPVWIALTLTPGLKPDGTPAMPEWEELLAFGGAVQNLHLMATSLGLSGQWSTSGVGLSPAVAELVGVAPPARPVGFFLLGRPSGTPPEAGRKPLADKVTWRR